MINNKTVELFTLCYNEEVILPHFLEYYSKFVDKITIYDNESTDNSINIINNFKKIPINVITYKTQNKLNDNEYLNIKNNCWKNSKCDYVIIVDCDEFFNFKDINVDFDIITPVGYEMVNNKIINNILEINEGVFENNYSKTIIFNPKKIKEINYTAGCHKCNFIGDNIIHLNNDNNYKLLHYKYINLEYVINKYTMYNKRLSEYNKNHNLGIQYTWGIEQITNYYNNLLKNKIKVI